MNLFIQLFFYDLFIYGFGRVLMMHTAQKMKFSSKDFFSKCEQIRSWETDLMENFIFCAVLIINFLIFAGKPSKNWHGMQNVGDSDIMIWVYWHGRSF